MRPRPYRQIVDDLRPLFAEKGIALETSSSGKGSHRSLIFVDVASEQRVSIVIPGTKEISKLVQRESIAYLRRREASFEVGHPARGHSARVLEIVERYFNG